LTAIEKPKTKTKHKPPNSNTLICRKEKEESSRDVVSSSKKLPKEKPFPKRKKKEPRISDFLTKKPDYTEWAC
jgi:hypothetical protein